MSDLRDTVIELSHFQKEVDFIKVKASGIEAVLHKASEGATVQDAKYKERAKLATEAGLLWGAYHVVAATSAPGEQVKNLLDMTRNGNGEYPLIVLSIQKNKSGKLPTLIVVEEMLSQLGYLKIVPIIFGSPNIIDALTGGSTNSNLFKQDLWIASWDDGIVFPNFPYGWKSFKFWQYTDKGNVSGVDDGKSPRSKFNGNEDELKKYWPQFKV